MYVKFQNPSYTRKCFLMFLKLALEDEEEGGEEEEHDIYPHFSEFSKGHIFGTRWNFYNL